MEREFRRLLEKLVRIIPKGIDVVWQTGRSAVDGLGIDGVDYMPAPRLAQAMREADVVVSHAGCGSALAALGAGRCPILVPRDPARGEVIDGHQAEIAEWLAARKLAVTAPAEALAWEDLCRAAAMSVARIVNPPQFQLATAA
jgi:UDP-N-acetylglucosamine transferase subunit ALG13